MKNSMAKIMLFFVGLFCFTSCEQNFPVKESNSPFHTSSEI